MQNSKHTWGQPLQGAICENCDWSYLLTPGQALPTCPHCYQTAITPLEDEEWDQEGAPELILPFAVPDDQVQKQLHSFSRSFRFTPHDLQAKNLQSRLRRVFIPSWLVDSDVTAVWQAETGFDYQVVSHQENFQAGSWQTRQVEETKIRWEARSGQLQRRYDNVSAPALEEIENVRAHLGSFERQKAVAYEQQMLDQSLIRLPNRNQVDAWPDTQPKFKERAAVECRQAAGADHIRQYKWQAQYANQHWSLLLLPVYSTWYFDDNQQPVPVLLNGRTGKFLGIKRASMKKAKRATTILAIIAALLFIVTLAVLFLEPSLTLLTTMLTFLVAISAILPIATVSRFNRDQAADVPFSDRQD
jgi:hypothetical protein